MESSKTTLLIGLGNPILGDDGVGWRVVQLVERILNGERKITFNQSVEYEFLSVGGLSLMETMVGYQNVVVVDALCTGKNPIGTLYSLPLSKLPDFSAGHTTSAHDTSLINALKVGKDMGLVLPIDVWVVGIEANQVFEFSDKLSTKVESVLSTAVDLVLEILQDGNKSKMIQVNS